MLQHGNRAFLRRQQSGLSCKLQPLPLQEADDEGGEGDDDDNDEDEEDGDDEDGEGDADEDEVEEDQKPGGATKSDKSSTKQKVQSIVC